MLDCVDVLKQLVSIPSVNPMGRDVSGSEYFETGVVQYLEGLLNEIGVPWLRQTVAPGRDNILARLDGDTPPDGRGKLVVLEAHMDTVPVDGMTIPPWEPIVVDGKLYGRGSCDVKGGLAAMLAAFARLVDEQPADRPTVVLAATVNEEYGFSGAKKLGELWSSHSAWLPKQPDAIVVAEPTLLDIVIAHKGTMRWQCSTHGRAAHSSRPERGENAIYKMARLVTALERYHNQVLSTLPTHPLCGRPTLSVGVIRGGISVNTVPDQCSIEIDRRIMPGEDPSAAMQHLLDFLSGEKLDFQPHHEPTNIGSSGLSDQNNGRLAAALASAAERSGLQPKKIGVPYGTNGSVYSAAGIPTVVFGPGDIAQAHTAAEFIEIEQLYKASDVYYEFAKSAVAHL